MEISEEDRDRVRAFTLRGRLYCTRTDNNIPELARNTVIRRSIEDLTAATLILGNVTIKQQADGDIFNCLAFALFKRFKIAHKQEDINAEILNRTKSLVYVEKSIRSVDWLG